MDNQELKERISHLSTEEKAELLSGGKANKTRNIGDFPAFVLSDGPSGVRMLDVKGDSLSGIADTLPSTVFPVGSNVAMTWNPSLASEEGRAIGKEAKYYGVSILLGPAMNIQRNPLCGRNFEYYSEDPLLTGKMASSFVSGVQEEGVGACLKHFACNSNEKNRFVGDSIVSKRALEEIYLRGFEIAVKEAKPASVMSAYNRINHVFCSENSWLLEEKLRKDWGFDGFVMTDWGACHDKVEGLKNGLDLEMPGQVKHNVLVVKEAIKKGNLSQEVLDQRVFEMLKVLLSYAPDEDKKDTNLFEDNKDVSKKIALESAVLLKNENHILPLDSSKKYACIGEMFSYPRYQGSGSSMLNPYHLTSPQDAFLKRDIAFSYAQGYRQEEEKPDLKLEEEALQQAEGADVILFFGGMSDFQESEGFDKKDLRLPDNQVSLLSKLLKQKKPVVFVLYTGTPIELSILDEIPAILNMGLAGEESGEATAALLFGEENPSGHLAQTWPLSYEDIPNGKEFTSSLAEYYKEDIYVGYRYSSTFSKKVRYPFGYGLSYTGFTLSDFRAEKTDSGVTFHASVTDTGTRSGKEVLQVYVRKPRKGGPAKELVAFTKVELLPGETKEVTFEGKAETLYSYNAETERRELQKGLYTFFLGENAEALYQSVTLELDGSESAGFEVPDLLHRTDEAFSLAISVPPLPVSKKKTLETPLRDFTSLFGRFFTKLVVGVGKRQEKKGAKIKDLIKRSAEMKAGNFVVQMMPNNSLRSMCYSASGKFDYPIALMMLGFMTHRPLKGLCDMVKEKTAYGRKDK